MRISVDSIDHKITEVDELDTSMPLESRLEKVALSTIQMHIMKII
jgi:hypothetical protein